MVVQQGTESTAQHSVQSHPDKQDRPSRDRRWDMDGLAGSVGPLARLDTLFHGISLVPCSGKPPVSPGNLCQGAFLGSQRPVTVCFVRTWLTGVQCVITLSPRANMCLGPRTGRQARQSGQSSTPSLMANDNLSLRAEWRNGGRNPASSPTSISQRRHPTCISAAHSLVGEQSLAALAVICKIASEIQINSVSWVLQACQCCRQAIWRYPSWVRPALLCSADDIESSSSSSSRYCPPWTLCYRHPSSFVTRCICCSHNHSSSLVLSRGMHCEQVRKGTVPSNEAGQRLGRLIRDYV